jgi:hypothetical protein
MPHLEVEYGEEYTSLKLPLVGIRATQKFSFRIAWNFLGWSDSQRS